MDLGQNFSYFFEKLIVENNFDFILFFISTTLIFLLLRKWFKKNYKISLRVLVGFTIIYSFVFYEIQDVTSRTKNEIFEKMSQITPTIHMLMDANGSHQMSLATKSDDPVYLRLIDLQKSILRESPEISDIYTLTQNENGQFAFLVDSETDYNHDGKFDSERETRTSIGEVFKPLTNDLQKAWAGEVVTTEPYEDKWGAWVSVFQPLKHDGGPVYAILGLDYSAQKFYSQISKERCHKLGIYFFLILTFSIGIISRSRLLLQQRELIHALNDKIRLSNELDLQKVKAAEGAKMAALGEMAAGLAHEINSPLTIIKGRAEQILRALEDESLDRGAFKKYADGIITTTDRISKIVQGLKKFSRNAAQDPLKPTSIRSIIDNTVEFCYERFQSNNVKLILPQKESEYLVQVRETQISQVLLNLINNAFDAVEKLEEAWVRVDVRVIENKLLEISVSDNGPGIPEEIASRIMEPFFTTKEAGKGTGLGLSISKEIIEAHSGRLILDQSSNTTKFIIQLPVAIS